MNLPKFTAESALSKSTRTYRSKPQFGSFSQSGVPSIVVQPSQMEVEGMDDADEAGLMGAEGVEEDGDATGLETIGDGEGADDEGVDDGTGDEIDDGGDDDSTGEGNVDALEE